MNYDFSNLWVEKWRPKTLSDFIISDKNKTIIDSFKDKKEIPNLLFTGTPGLGKTSLAKILVNDILDCQYLYINASDENGIDTIRNKVTGFAQTKSLDGKIKVIILDETDGLSIDAQRALRNTIEEFAKITRFILTANYNYRVIPALQSRCQSFDLTPPMDGVVKRCVQVLKAEKIVIKEEEKPKLLDFIKSNYPDLRKCLNELQKYSSSGTLQLADTKNNEVLQLIFNEIKKKNITALRKALIENEAQFNNDYVTLMRNLFNYIDDVETNVDLKRYYLLTLSEYIYRSSFVIDQEINCYSCLISLSEAKS
jgi:DNA polymerase III delta prime subunit